MRASHVRVPLLLITTLFFAACGGSDSPTAPGEEEPDEPTGPTIVENPTFSGDVMGIFTRNSCTTSGCHGTGAGGLTMTDASTTYDNLVNVASATSGEILVIPNDAQNSYLMKKLDGTAAFGARMPLGGSPLDNVDMTNLRNWINNGAPEN